MIQDAQLAQILTWTLNHAIGLEFAGALVAGAAFAWFRFMPRIHSREKMYAMDIPFSLCGRPDLVMQEWGGELVIHDHKTRRGGRVYESDVLQLSLYAILVASATKRRVARHGFIRTIDPQGGQRIVRVPLIEDVGRLMALHARFMDVARQPSIAQKNGPRHLCKQCGFYGKQCPGSSRS